MGRMKHNFKQFNLLTLQTAARFHIISTSTDGHKEVLAISHKSANISLPALSPITLMPSGVAGTEAMILGRGAEPVRPSGRHWRATAGPRRQGSRLCGLWEGSNRRLRSHNTPGRLRSRPEGRGNRMTRRERGKRRRDKRKDMGRMQKRFGRNKIRRTQGKRRTEEGKEDGV